VLASEQVNGFKMMIIGFEDEDKRFGQREEQLSYSDKDFTGRSKM
jgi:hypothetical protein